MLTEHARRPRAPITLFALPYVVYPVGPVNPCLPVLTKKRDTLDAFRHNPERGPENLSTGGEDMAQRKKSRGRRYGKSAQKNVERTMRRRKHGTLRSGKGGKGGKVKSRKQAIAIGLSEARKRGAKVPPKKKAA